MKQDIRLYLSGLRADLREDPKILFNYRITDTNNPAAVKNNFTKTVTLDGTDNNNAIFGAIYDLSRLQTYGAGQYSGTDFNPLKKADFELYIDSELFEQGYFKLTEVVKTRDRVQYSIVCYGGLGEFIYNLSSSESGNKLEFKDLRITPNANDPYEVEDLGFTISKETISEAWGNVLSNGKYSHLNFVPCYNGFGGIDTAHVLINLKDKPTTINNVTGITSVGGWAKGTCSRDLTEWETRDLRSYMQRPALRVKTLINTCCNPDNNGGYRVELDEKFFNEENPYYNDTWLTLGLVSDILGTDNDSTSEEITGATVEYQSSNLWEIKANADFSSFNNLSLDLRIDMAVENPSAQALYLGTRKNVKNTTTLQTRFVKKIYEYYSAILLQLVAYDELGNVVGTSNAYQLLSKIPGLDQQPDFRDQFSTNISIPEWRTLYGYFARTGETYTWVDERGAAQGINFTFPSNTTFHTLKLRIQRPSYEYYKRTGVGGGWVRAQNGTGSHYLFEAASANVNGNYEPGWYRSNGAAWGDAEFYASDFKVTATRYGGFLSGKQIPQDRVLTLGITPAEFLLSYTKLFGLHIWKDPIERTIYIADRSVFYKRDEIVDINTLIDRSKDIKITPQVAQTKWYDFNTEQHESEANMQYQEQYGMDFGLQRVNTNFDFDTEIRQAYDGKFRGGVQVLENSYYYYKDFIDWPVYFYNGFTLTTYTQSGTSLVGTEQVVNTFSEANVEPINQQDPGFDLFDKPQFHGPDNEQGDGSLVLLFYRGQKNAGNTNYLITDDIEQMVTLNEKKPCWIVSEGEYDRGGNRIGITATEFPKFSRYCTYESTGSITHSLDFGRTQETYIPNTTLSSGCSIYERCWKNYIADMYDVNSRLLSCYCLIRGQVSLEHLRKFYYFDNSLFILNQLKEWNPGTYDTTLCEFIKVNDIENYDLAAITQDPLTDFYLSGYTPTSTERTAYRQERHYLVPVNVSAVTGVIEVQDGGPWSYGDGRGAYAWIEYDNGTSDYILYSDLTESGNDGGAGNTVETFNIGVNDTGTGRTIHLNIVIYGASGDHWYYVIIRQESGEISTIYASRFAGNGPVPASGGTVLLTVTSDTPWTATTQENYVASDRNTGLSGSSTVVLTVEENEGEEQRECSVLFENESGATYTYSVMQEPAGVITRVKIMPSDYTFPSSEASTLEAVVACPTGLTWTIYSAAWITATPSTGEGGYTEITLAATANTGSTARFGNVVVYAGGDSWSVTIGQSAPGTTREGIFLTISSYALPGESGTYGITVESTVPWHLEYSPWIAPSLYAGTEGRTDFNFTASENNSRYGRVGYIRATGAGYQAEASITQDPMGN